MVDAENTVPSSKKRAAGREISRDNPGLDDDEDSSEQDAGTFKRASDEVLATRKIVKVRRQQTNSTPSSNPFAGIRLVAPTEPSADAAGVSTEVHPAGDAEDKVSDDVNDSDDKTKDAEKAKDENTKQSESKTDEVEDKSTGDKEDSLEKEDPTNTAHKEDAADKDSDNPSEANKTETDNEQTKDGDKTENLDNEENKVATEEQTAEGGPLKSFQQLSSSQNAFTGLSGSGFSFGTSLGNGSSSIFGLKSDKPFGLTLPTNGNSSIFVASGASTVSKSEGSGLPTMQEVAVETGEENERVVFTADSVLFEYVDGGWKERGKGELKVNVTATGTDRARLLMRARGNYRLILNASLYPDMKLTNMDKKGVTFACVNSASEGKDGLSTFALKFKDNSIMEEFRATVVAHKDKTSTAQKTPENSPEASGD